MAWGDVADHDGFAVANEGVLEHEGEFGATEWLVAFLLVKGTDAFLEGEEGFVDFGSIETGLFVGVHNVGASLAAR